MGVVDDDPETAKWIEEALRGNPDYALIGNATSVAQGITLLSAAPDVMFIDLGLPDASGLTLIELIAQRAQRVASIVVSVMGDASSITRAIACGAQGYLLKGAEPLQLEQVLSTVMTGGAVMSPSIAAHVLSLFRASLQHMPARERESAPSLTAKEHSVLEALARGLTFKEVARELEISTHTVTDHVKAIYRKLAVNSRAAAVYAALQAGLLQLRC